MPSRFRVLIGSACAAVLVAGAGVAIADGPNGSAVSAQCYSGAATPASYDGHAALPCKFAEGTTNQAGADCRIVAAAPNDAQCANIDGRDISAAAITAYQGSWAHQALTLQRGLDANAPLIEEQIPHTHNTFNTSAYVVPGDSKQPAYYPTLTNQDPNQAYSITNQLNMDVRAIELDLHWQPSPYGNAATHGYWVTMCHGDDGVVPGAAYVQLGCTDDRPAQSALTEVRSWLDTHKDQFLLIYLENQLDGSPVADQLLAHNTAASLLRTAFATNSNINGGSLVYKPTGVAPNRCATLPYTTSRAQMMATGARVLLVGNCGPGSWSGLVFQRDLPGHSMWDESGDPRSYSAYDCTRDRQLRANDTMFRREFEDSTFVSAATGSGPKQLMSAQNVADMVRCGVNIIGMDQLRPQDDDPYTGRLAALVWSWAVNQPSTGTCALQGPDGRFRSSDCGGALPAACLTGNVWSVTAVPVPWSNAADECVTEFPGSTFSVPVNGFRDDLLRRAHAGVGSVWLNYAKVGGAWTPNVQKPSSPPYGGPGSHGRGHAYAYGRGHGTGEPIKN